MSEELEGLSQEELYELLKLKQKKLELLEQKEVLKQELPFLYKDKEYVWSRRVIESESKRLVCTAANQIGKSVSGVKRVLNFITDTDKWASRWPKLHARGGRPSRGWVLYPDSKTATSEFEDKWLPLMAQGKMRDHPKYGFKKPVYANGRISQIEFLNGFTLEFRTYSQDAANLQAGSLALLHCFIAGTKILTQKGEMPIEEIKKGDLVWTRSGLRSVGFISSREAETITRHFSNGSSLTGTPDHPVWTENRGWTRLDSLTPRDRLITSCTWNIQSNKNLKESFTEEIQTLNTDTTGTILELTREEKALSFTEKFGKIFIKKTSLKDLMSTIKTTIHSTILQRICSLLSMENTQNITQQKQRNTSNSLTNGKQKIENLLSLMLKESPTLELKESLSVKGVLKSSSQQGAGLSSAMRVVEKLFTWPARAISRKKYVHVVDRLTCPTELNSLHAPTPVVPYFEKQKRKVYCLNVEGQPEYFANGILVHNCDEELPFHLYPELALRLEAQDGYMSFVFTATLGQVEWREIVEDRTKWVEDDVEVIHVSMYDCVEFEDGSPGLWPLEKIERVKARMPTEAEVLRRVYGRFVVDSGLKYPTFDRKRHIKKGHPMPKSWIWYAGADYGGGGDETSKKSHPSALGFIAVNPDHTQGRIVRTWRGDGELTTADDVVKKYIEICEELKIKPIACFYDWGAKDLGTIAKRLGLPFVPAEKSHSIGEGIVNTLFKNDAIAIADDSGFTEELSRELEGLLHSTPKKSAKDDLIDGALRYPCAKIPWDMDRITSALPKKEPPREFTQEEQEIRARRGIKEHDSEDLELLGDMDGEMEFWGNMYDS